MVVGFGLDGGGSVGSCSVRGHSTYDHRESGIDRLLGGCGISTDGLADLANSFGRELLLNEIGNSTHCCLGGKRGRGSAMQACYS